MMLSPRSKLVQKNPGFPAEKCHHFLTEKCTFLQKNALSCQKNADFPADENARFRESGTYAPI